MTHTIPGDYHTDKAGPILTRGAPVRGPRSRTGPHDVVTHEPNGTHCMTVFEKADDDRESGYLFGDSYAPDAGFSVFRVADIPVDRFTGPNRTILAFVRGMYPAAEFLIIWH